MLSSKNMLKYFTLLVAIVLSVVLHVYGLKYAEAELDNFKQYLDMKEYYDSGVYFPIVGTRMWNAVYDNTPSMPGGFYYFVYTNIYRIAQGNFFVSRVLFSLFCLSSLFIFIFWFFKRFGKNLGIVTASLLLCNAYLLFASIDIYNPNLPIYLSFIFLILFCEYSIDDKYSKLGALLMFPVLALMAQVHFALFFSMVPTLIIYLIINFKRQTKKYIIPLLMSVFVSFLIYLPYLISEIASGFENTQLMLAFRGDTKFVGLPQMYAMILFPTTEMSIFYGRTNAILLFWFKNNPFMIFGAIMLLATVIFSITALFFSIRKTFSKKIDKPISKPDIMLHQSMILYVLYLVVTPLVFFIAKSKPGTFHYIYSAFALSFIPIIILIKHIFDKVDGIKIKNIKINNNKIKNITYIFFILISIVLFLQIMRTFNIYTSPYTYNKQKSVVEAIVKDSDGKDFQLQFATSLVLNSALYTYASQMFGLEDKWNLDEEADIIYFIDNRDLYLYRATWDDAKDNKNRPIPANSVKIHGDDNLAVYRLAK